MENIEEIFKKINSKDDLELFKLTHKKIISLGQNVKYAIFPIYIRYMIKEKVVGLLYFNRKNFLELGLNISKGKASPNVFNAAYMKYPGITCGIKILKKSDIKNVKIDK